MINGIIVKCDQCERMEMVKLEEVKHRIAEDWIQILDRHVCSVCCARARVDEHRAEALS
jgi:hypothetical protein